MRVIKYGPKEEEIVCNHCGSLLAYTEKDEYWESDEYYGRMYFYTYIRCPVCKERIILRQG